MLSAIKRLRKALVPAAEIAPFTELQLAAAVLLLEVSCSDFERQPEEKTAVLQALARAFDMSNDQVSILYDNALQSADHAVSLHNFVTVINRECSPEQKMILLEQLWRVAFVDGRIDKYEDHRIRRIAELLHMPHRAFIQSKHAAAAEGEENRTPERLISSPASGKIKA
ncbi:MAG TPA: TerB family tellurite resistance protein [Gammaproteobacteria bacterium]